MEFPPVGERFRAVSGWNRLLFSGAVLASFAGCRCQRPGAPPAPGDAALDGAIAAVDAGAPAAVLLLNNEAIEHASWTADGAVVALSRRRFWWFRPDGGGRAQTTVLEGDDPFPHFATAKSKDVSVVTAGGKAHVFHGPKEVSSFPVGEAGAKALSDDGAVLVTERMENSSREGTHFRGALYDISTGKRLSEHASVPVLSPNGEWAIAGDGIRSTRTGEKVLDLGEKTYSLADASPWSDGGAMAWTEGGLVIGEPKARTVVKVPARCKSGEIDQLIEVVDPATKQAVRFCGSRVLVVRVTGEGPPGVVEIKTPASRKGVMPSLAFARDDGAPLIVWGFPVGAEIDRIDPRTRSLAKAASGIERPNVRTTDEGGAPSPDGRSRLSVDSSLSRTGAVTVLDAAGKELVHFGATTSMTTNGGIAPFVHEHGLDVLVGDGAKAHRVRIGPDAAPLVDLPRLLPESPCTGVESETMPAQRTLTGDSAIFAWPMGGSCVCVRGGCTDPQLPPGVLARRDDKLIVSEPGRAEVTYLEQRKERGKITWQGEPRGATFLDDGTAAALFSLRRSPQGEIWSVSEVKLPGFEALRPPVEIEQPIFGGWDYSLSGTKDSIVVLLSDRYMLKGWILPRGPRDGGSRMPTRVEAWDDGAVVTLPDGRLELYGPAAERAVVCADGLGAITLFATCRVRFEAKGAFRID